MLSMTMTVSHLGDQYWTPIQTLGDWRHAGSIHIIIMIILNL